MTGHSKSFRQNLLLLFFSILITAIFAEIALRVFLPAPIVWKYPQEQYQYDSEISHWLEPNQQAYTHDKSVKTNSVGIRDKEFETTSPPGIYRILAIGDSQTFGNGLELADTWPKQLEAISNQTTIAMNVEVINAGLPGSDTWQHEIILERMLSTYRPDAVVLALYVNDVVERFNPKPTTESKNNQLVKRVGYILKQSALLLTLRSAMQTIQQLLSPNKGAALQTSLMKGESSPELEKRWEQVDRSLAAIKRKSNINNSRFGIVLLPRRDQISGQIPWEAYRNRLVNIAERHQIPVVSAFTSLQEAYKTYGAVLFIPWDGHNSKIANKVIAQEIADKLEVVRPRQ